MWAVINYKGEAVVVSLTERGAKRYASLNGYNRVGQISKYSLSVYNLSVKVKSRWIKEEE